MMGRRLFLAVIENGVAETGAALAALPLELHRIPVSRIIRCADAHELQVVSSGMHAFDWVLLTSANAAACFFDLMNLPPKDCFPKIACIGPDTAGHVEKRGYAVDFISTEYRGDAFAREFASMHGASPKPVLVPRPAKMGSHLIEVLEQSGIRSTQIILYRTEPLPPETLPGIHFMNSDLFAFLSPSGVRNFFNHYSVPDWAPVFAIGPATAGAIRECGHARVFMAAEFSRTGLVDAVRAFLDNEPLPMGERT